MFKQYSIMCIECLNTMLICIYYSIYILAWCISCVVSVYHSFIRRHHKAFKFIREININNVLQK